MPYKIWTVGEEVLASDFNAYIQNQVISTFPTAAARNTAITSPVEGMVTWINDQNRLEVYNGTAWELFVLPPYTMSFAYEPLTTTPVLAGEATFVTPTYNYKMLVELGWGAWSAFANGTTIIRFLDMAGATIGPSDLHVSSPIATIVYAAGFQFLTATRTAGTAASLRIHVWGNPASGGVRNGLAKVTIIQV